MRRAKAICTAICFFIVAVTLQSCSTQHAGGSEIGNPRVVVGRVTDSSGISLPDVALYLIDPAEKDPLKLVPDSCHKACTNFEGQYFFTGVYDGVYNLLGIDSRGIMMFLREMEINGNEYKLENDTVHSGIDTLEDVATIIVILDDCRENDSAVFFIPGTVIQLKADTCGEYTLRCPPSVIDVAVFRDDSLVMLAENANVEPGELVDLTGKSYYIPPSQIVSGLISGSVGLVYSFSAGTVTLGPNHPVQYRYDWGDSVSDWSFSSQRNHVWYVPGIYQVRVQARSYRDTLSVSEWSDTVSISVD